MEQIFIFIIAALFWAGKAWWDKQQEKLAAEELERRERAERAARPASAPGGQGAPAQPAYSPDQRYKDIQEEIRRRIAERQGLPQSAAPAPSAPPMTPAPRNFPQPAQRTAPPYKPSPAATPPIRPATAPVFQRPKPVPPAPVAQPIPEFVPMPFVLEKETEETKAYSHVQSMREAEAYPDEAAAYSLTRRDPAAASGLRVALASPNAARQAFVMREIFDKPLSLRSRAGGHEDWN